MTPPLDAVVLDFDGTMLDTETPEFRSVQAAWAEHGQELTLERWLPSIGAVTPFDWVGELEARVGHPLDREAVRARRWECHKRLIEAQEVQPGVVRLLDECAAAGVPVGVASNSPEAWVDGHLRRLGLRDRIATVRCIDHVVAGKPAPDVYLAVLHDLDARPGASVAVEDSPPGVRAATSAGLACLGVRAGMTADLPLPGARRVVRSLADVHLADLAALVDGDGAGREPSA